MMTLDLKKLKEVVNITNGKRSGRTSYEDFIELFAIHISNIFDPVHRAERAARAADIKKFYTEAELQKMAYFQNLFVETVVGFHQRGQYINIFGQLSYELVGFMDHEEPTPDDLSSLVGELVFASGNADAAKGTTMQDAIDANGYFTISDCSVGTGGLLISAAEKAHAAGINYCERMVALGVEAKKTLLHQSYIQLSLYGIPSVLIHGNSLTQEEFSRWYTPMYITGKWVWRCPLGMTNARNQSDELLKMYQEPMYRAVREAQSLFDQAGAPDESA